MSTREATPPPTPVPAPMIPSRKALTFNHIFDGDKTIFKSWHTAIISKLNSDSAFIGNYEQQSCYMNETLSMKIRQRVALEYINGSAVNYNPAYLLEYLERIYSDAKAADRARISWTPEGKETA
ncbi:hypothetical protein E4U19_006567 [Claviceps sp. Clav32 group G5]|nr:hypothetical protein E4U19_006567 [Claviceps sp. Clav32 group G5]